MPVALCPECGCGIDLGARPCEDQRVICVECRAHLEVISLSPLELDWVYDEPNYTPDEDWHAELDWKGS
jgi:lysine biosynthesis protein LysW